MACFISPLAIGLSLIFLLTYKVAVENLARNLKYE